MKRKNTLIFGLIIILTLSNLTFVYADRGDNNSNRQKNKVKTESKAKVRETYKVQNNEIKITKEVVKYEKEYIKVNLEIPVISGLYDKEYQRELNTKIERKILEEKNEFEEEAKKRIEESKRQGKVPRDMEYVSKYEQKNSTGVLTVIVKTYSYLGGANGANENYYYNTLIQENKSIQLSNLFKSGSNYKEKINNEINRQIAERVEKGEIFFEGKDEFETIADDHDFYIEDNKLFLAFPEYSIAPRYMGIVEFSIPIYQLEPLLRNQLPIIEDSVYYNSKYNIQFKIPCLWKDSVYISEIYYVNDMNLKVDFVYTPKDSKYGDYKLMSIIVMDKKVYYNLSDFETNKLGDVIADASDYVYIINSYANPYLKDTREYKEYRALSTVIDEVEDLFKIKYDKSDELKNVRDYRWVIINGKKENLSKDMYKTKDGTIMIPIRKVAKKLGYNVKWNPQNDTVTINNGIESTISIGEYNYEYFKIIFKLEEAATIKKGTVFVPISYLEQVLELQVEVDSDGILTINSK